MASDSSAKAGSKVLRGNGASPETLLRAESRNEERDDGRSGVVGLDVRVLDVDRARLVLESRFELGMVLGNWAAASKDFPRVPCRLSLSGIGVPGCDAMRICFQVTAPILKSGRAQRLETRQCPATDIWDTCANVEEGQ